MGEVKGGWGAVGAVAGEVPGDTEPESSSAQQKGPLGQTPGKGREHRTAKSSHHCWLHAAPDSSMTGLMIPLTEAQRLALLPVSETATAECWGAEPIWEIKERDFGETI